MDRRAQLLRWIEDTRRLQRRLAVGFAVLGLVAAAVVVAGVPGGVPVLTLLALVALISFWVTAAHNAEHRQKLEELTRLDRRPP